MNNLKNFTSINCICCGSKIELYDAINNPHFDMNEFMNQYQPNDRYRPESQIWENGIVEGLSAGYGSKHDGSMYYIGICDECVETNTLNGRLRYSGCYLGFDVFNENDLLEFDKKRNRENNINSLMENQSTNSYKIKLVSKKWIDIKEGDYNTLPSEGINVLISDGINHDVAYYIRSGEYKWLKVNIKNDEAPEFDDFIPIKWKYID